MKRPPLSFIDELPTATREEVEAAATERSLETGEVLVREGDVHDSLACLVRGRLEVVRSVEGSRQEHRIHELGPGEPIGEVAFFDGKARSATVRALEPSLVLIIPYKVVAALPVMVRGLGRHLADRLRSANQDELEAMQRRAAMGALIVKVIALLCGYTLLISALPSLDLPLTSTTYLSVPLIAAFGVGAWRFIWRSGYPLGWFGLGTKNLVWSATEAVVLTVPFLAVLVGIKWVALRLSTAGASLPLFERTDLAARLAEPKVMKLLAVYGASSLVQELIVRCALQSSLEEFLVGPSRRGVTLVLCALMFSVNHLHMSVRFALLAFIPGMFWGWLFARRRHLIGPFFSHFVVGAFVFFILGIRIS